VDLSFYSHILSDEDDKEEKTLLKRQSLSKGLARDKLEHASSKLHVVYLYASPLVVETNPQELEDNIPPIGFSHEFEEVMQSLAVLNKQLKFLFQRASFESVKEALNEEPLGIHFSCHGFKGDNSLIKKSKKLKGHKLGDCLLFEDHLGKGVYFWETEIQKVLQEATRNRHHLRLDFVVINSCHSENIGKAFAQQGADHVICITRLKTLNDKAAVLFSRTFYGHLFNSKHSICEAYHSAVNSVTKMFGVMEGKKFKIFHSADHEVPCRKNEKEYKLHSGAF